MSALAPWSLFEVSVPGFVPSTVAARSRSAASYAQFLAFTDAFDCTFRQWVGMAKVRRVDTPKAGDPYAYVRQHYGVDVRHGSRVTLTGEGANLEGRGATVIHPGRDSTHYVHLVIDGEDHASRVHPLSVRVQG